MADDCHVRGGEGCRASVMEMGRGQQGCLGVAGARLPWDTGDGTEDVPMSCSLLC